MVALMGSVSSSRALPPPGVTSSDPELTQVAEGQAVKIQSGTVFPQIPPNSLVRLVRIDTSTIALLGGVSDCSADQYARAFLARALVEWTFFLSRKQARFERSSSVVFGYYIEGSENEYDTKGNKLTETKIIPVLLTVIPTNQLKTVSADFGDRGLLGVLNPYSTPQCRMLGFDDAPHLPAELKVWVPLSEEALEPFIKVFAANGGEFFVNPKWIPVPLPNYNSLLPDVSNQGQ